jgi:hypothetical protein
MDWLSEDYESTLTAFVPDAGLENILQNYFDTIVRQELSSDIPDIKALVE